MAAPPINTPAHFGMPATAANTAAPASNCPARMNSAPTQISDAMIDAHALPVAILEEVADGQVVAFGREPPDARADDEREDRASRCRPSRSRTTR